MHFFGERGGVSWRGAQRLGIDTTILSTALIRAHATTQRRQDCFSELARTHFQSDPLLTVTDCFVPLPLDNNTAIQQTGILKATFQIPDDLYREMKAEVAREGRTMREVTIQLFRQWLLARQGGLGTRPRVNWRDFPSPLASRISAEVGDHSMEAIRTSIEKGRHVERD